ncbi:MAG: hypothetical protein AAAFM81_10325 [Pseudomonadota bacterium]
MIQRILASLTLLMMLTAARAEPLITGIVEDVEAQTIEMPSLPGAWQRRIEWMAPEGSEVKVGDLVVRLDPGSLISEEENARVDLEKQQFSVRKRLNELELEVLQAEQTVARDASAVKIAELDAVIPVDTIPRLDYERYQLTLATAVQTLERSESDLRNKRATLVDQRQQAELELKQAELNFERMRDALQATEIYAEKGGYLIYGDNFFTGRKVFPGDTLYAGFKIASVAGRRDLRVKFFVHEADFLAIDGGQQLTVIADAKGTPAFDVVIERRATQATDKEDWSDSGYFEAIAKPVTELPASIMPGMSVLGVPADAEGV